MLFLVCEASFCRTRAACIATAKLLLIKIICANLQDNSDAVVGWHSDNSDGIKDLWLKSKSFSGVVTDANSNVKLVSSSYKHGKVYVKFLRKRDTKVKLE